MTTTKTEDKPTKGLPEFRHVPLKMLTRSKTNPRTVFDKKAQTTLEASIRKVGVLEPLLARPVNGKLEVVAGERRFRAAEAVGLKTIPVRVKKYSDVEALEVQVIENQQREDLHPLEEAEGYKALMKEAGYDTDTLAKKVGMSRSYVYQRLKLAELIPQLKTHFRKKEITAGHAILVARLQPSDQRAALANLTVSDWEGNTRTNRIRSVREFARWINDNVHLDLHGAPFKKNDKDLVPKAGPCTTCPKRTGYAPMLFPDVKKKDTCTDRTCFRSKLEAFIIRKEQELKAAKKKTVRISEEYSGAPMDAIAAGRWTKARENKCKNLITGIYVDGQQVGESADVCTSTRCKVHHNFQPMGRSSADDQNSMRLQRERQRKQLLIKTRVLERVLEKTPQRATRLEIEVIARACWQRHWHEIQVGVARRRGWIDKRRSGAQEEGMKRIPQMKDRELLGFVIELALGPDIYNHWGRADKLFPLARKYRINPTAIERQVTKEFKERKRKKKTKKTKESKTKK